MIAHAGRWRRVTGAAVAAALLGGVAGCGASTTTSPPTGVDGLVVPTPSPRPSDFVERIDNPWLAWTPGSVTTYDQAGASGTAGSSISAGPVRVAVSAGPTRVAGLDATGVTTTGPGGAGTVDWFAQDRVGNVWWLGRAGQWTAGQDGAEAGLWMPADPRVGDGFRQALADGVVADVATVTLAPAADAPAQDEPETRLEVSSTLHPATTVSRTYRRGSGLVRELRSGEDGYLRTVAAVTPAAG